MTPSLRRPTTLGRGWSPVLLSVANSASRSRRWQAAHPAQQPGVAAALVGQQTATRRVSSDFAIVVALPSLVDHFTPSWPKTFLGCHSGRSLACETSHPSRKSSLALFFSAQNCVRNPN